MPFIAAKSLMFLRNTPARTTSSKLLPAAFKTAERFWKMRSVSAAMPPETTLPVAGSWPTCPLKKRKPSMLTAWENGPPGGASSDEVIAVLLMAALVGTSAADQCLDSGIVAGHLQFHKCTFGTMMLQLAHDSC